ncbi:MAG: glycogen/starch synthase [Muribaculaceae bacterium]|nr:glycogen/starch synthase [Muribaculaceae bacterium]
MIDLLFETSWEVCNKVGGIYAVLSTKAKTLQAKYKEVIFIGPDLDQRDDNPFFTETATELDEWKQQAKLPAGMTVRTGKWNVPGNPTCVLVGYNSLYVYKNELFAEMWRRFGVDSLHAYGDYDESCIFSYGAALVIESIVAYNSAKRVVAHFDEWTTGMGLLYVKSRLPQVATVFTTHATSIGRSICGNGKPLYDYMTGYNGDQMAQELNMESKHSLEKSAVHEADVFTTVSDVTARECEQLLERRPVVTPNAFEQNYVPKGAKYTATRKAARERLLDVASALSGEELGNDCLLVATSGRCEMRNKGIDLYLDTMNVLRHSEDGLLKRKVVAFVLVPGWTDEARNDLKDALNRKKAVGLFNPIITHTIHNEDGDAIYGKMNYLGFRNQPEDNVKVIYVPSYLNGDDGIFDMPYYDLLTGFDLSIFPSYYEPWGYTPLESVAMGVPTITTNLAGFGQWVEKECGNNALKTGVKVIHRTDSNYDEALAEIVESVVDVSGMTVKQRDKLRSAARATSKQATWEHFMKYYTTAYDLAFKNAKDRTAHK